VTKSSGSKESGVARLVAVRITIVLGVLSRSQGLVTFLTFQTLWMPIFTERRLLLGEVDFFLTTRTLRHDFRNDRL
jgi:hypothetical protein